MTIVITARERFSAARESLESVLADTTYPFRIVYVDGRSPRTVRRFLESHHNEHSFQYVRSKRYLTPNEARNIGIRHAATKYVAFIDNDVIVGRGWLHRLVRCAEETGADIVGPLYLEDRTGRIHMAGGEASIRTSPDGERILHEQHRFAGVALAEKRHPTVSEPTELVEFHCMLARRKLLDRVGPLDESLQSVGEHVDLCMLARESGSKIYLEPASAIMYLRPARLKISDMPYFMLRWSESWNGTSVRRLVKKWKLSERAKDYEVLRFGRSHRLAFLAPRFRRRFVAALEVRFNRYILPALMRAARVR